MPILSFCFNSQSLTHNLLTEVRRLLQLIYKMMLDSEAGPRFQLETSSQVNCVSPYVLDVVYKLLYSAPCSYVSLFKVLCDQRIKILLNHKSLCRAELMVKEV